jgi:hypothetical protein
MPRSSKRLPEPTISDQVLEAPESSVLELLDSLLNKGVMVNGDVTLGVAGIDLIYLRLSSILCAADRILPPNRSAPPRKTPRRRPALRKQKP